MRIGKAFAQNSGEHVRREIAFRDHVRRPHAGKIGRVRGLVIVRRDGERHQDRGPSRRLQFCVTDDAPARAMTKCAAESRAPMSVKNGARSDFTPAAS